MRIASSLSRNPPWPGSSRPESWYLDLKVWDQYRDEWGAWHPHPVTMPSNLILALASSIMRIEEKGVEAWVAQRADLAKRAEDLATLAEELQVSRRRVVDALRQRHSGNAYPDPGVWPFAR